MNFNDEDEVLDLFRRLLEQLQQADGKQHGSKIEFVYVASGAQHVDHVDNQYFYGDACPMPRKTSKENKLPATNHFGADTPLSALFRENHHEELRQIIDSWRAYLIGDDLTIDALAMTRFEFDRKQIYSKRVYYDLLDLDAVGALQVSLSDLAHYLADHSNLSNSYATLYRLIKKYRQERP